MVGAACHGIVDDGAGNIRRYILVAGVRQYQDSTAGTITYSTDTHNATESHAIAFTMGNISETPLAADQTADPYCEDGYWNDSTDGNDADNYNVGNPAFEISYAKAVSTNTSITEAISSINTNVVFNNTATVSDVFDSTFGIIRNPLDTVTAEPCLRGFNTA